MKQKSTASQYRHSSKESAGILLYPLNGGMVEVLLAHPGGSYWRRRDASAWTIPKAEIEPREDAHTVAAVSSRRRAAVGQTVMRSRSAPFDNPAVRLCTSGPCEAIGTVCS